jgi:uncharacterized membrane protein YraQ (UPF0718 family)
MADIAHPGAPPQTLSRGVAPALVGAIVACTAALWWLGTFQQAWLSNFTLIFTSLLLGAMPLVVLGAVVGSAISVFVPDSAIARIARLPDRLQIPAAALSGLAFPVCECGSVPVARRLVGRGMTPTAAITFMLAAPILNPIVIVSTVIAYRGREALAPIVLGRIGLGLIAAMAVGWIVGGSTARLAEARARSLPVSEEVNAHEAGNAPGNAPGASRWRHFFDHVVADFFFMGRYLVLGAAAAAAIQTVVPQSVMSGVAGTPILSLLAMMGLAFILALCSESDAFVAASFVQFGVGAQLAFLVFGPLMDTKLAFLYSATFGKRLFTTVLAVVTVVTLVGTLWIEVLFG